MAKEYRRNSVEAFAASWIEIKSGNIYPVGKPVEAFAASWIEISIILENFYDLISSKPLRLRGLKSQ